MNTFKRFITLSLSLVMLFTASCVDKDFDHDEPPADGVDPELTVTNTIASLKTMYLDSAQDVLPIPSGTIIAGIVISDDTQGNFYKDIVIQDATTGILIRVDVSGLSANYPKGRRVFVKCTGLYMGVYGEMIQIGINDGSGGVGRIPASLASTYLVRGKWNQSFDVKVVSSFDSINPNDPNLQNIAVRFTNVHFLEPCETWSDPTTSTNRTLVDANDTWLTVRTSNFSTFAGNFIPGDTGVVEGVLQVFNGDFQLILRDLNDIQQFNVPNCYTGPATSIEQVRNLFTGTQIQLGANSIIQGTVISDNSNGTITGNNVVIQDGNFGIVLRFTSPNTFVLGDRISFDASGADVYEYNGLLEIDGVDIANASKIGTAAITPRNATVADILANGQTWESTLVKISNVTISGNGGIYSGSTTLDDGTGTMTLFTRSQSSFAANTYPTNPVSITGYIGDFNGLQLSIRNTSDVQ